MQIELAKTLILSSLIFIYFASIGSATNYYVSNDGSNSNTGLLIDDTWATPSHAVSGTGTASNVTAGDTIYLLNGTWIDEVVDFNVSGTSGHPITMTEYNGTPIIYTDDGHDAWGDNENGYFGIEIKGQQYINVSGITMGGYRADVWIGNSDNIHESNMNLGKYKTYDSQFAYMAYYDVHDSSFTDSICNESYHNTVCVWGHIYNSSPAIPHYTSNVTIDGNTIGNSSTHNLIDLNDFVYNITISNNKIYDNTGQTGIWMHSYNEIYENVSILYNDFQNCHRSIRTINTTNLRIIGNTFSDTGISGDLRMYGEYGGDPDCVNQNIFVIDNVFNGLVQTESIITGLFENNTIQSGEYYRFENCADIIVRNENGNNFEMRVDSNSDVVYEYTDGTVFEADITRGTNYASPNDVRFYSTGSRLYIEDIGSLRYDFTVHDGFKSLPKTDYLYDIKVNKYDTSLPEGEILVDFTAESTDSENVVFTVSDLKPNHYYNIKKDDNDFKLRQADSMGQIQFTNSVWSQAHSFSIEENCEWKIIQIILGYLVSISNLIEKIFFYFGC
ncbi:MAG: right-handed parallel beta-helix repeat-containing protein [Desulfobacteraceae bacterium]|nr:right-handed parallel beta-helix repeat-containing protein [Desulfobacteraceae bacterium]